MRSIYSTNFIGKVARALFGAALLSICCATIAQAQVKETYQYQTTEDLPESDSGKPVQPLVISLPRPALGKLLVIENVNARIELPQGQNCLCTLATTSPRFPGSEQNVSLMLPSTLVFREAGPNGHDIRVINGLERLYVEGNNVPGGFHLQCERNISSGKAQVRVSVIGYVIDAAQR